MKCTYKPLTAESWKYTLHNLHNPTTQPQWLQQALLNQSSITIVIRPHDYRMSIYTPTYSVKAFLNDYIIYDALGRITPYDPIEYDHLFQETK